MSDPLKELKVGSSLYEIVDAWARANKQDTLVSGTNIKTINGTSLLGSGDITVSGAQNTWYGVCPTGATTQAKIVTTTTGDFSLEIGNMVRVKFNNAQTYNGGITLNVDGTGAKSAMRNGTTATTQYFYLVGEVVDFVYDGTYFMAVNEGIASTTYYGVTKLTNSATSTSTTTSATPNAVKIAYDLADSKSIVSVTQTLTSGTEIGSVTVDGTATTLYAPSGGDTVTVQQTLTSGTEIGGVTVNGTQTKLYAPSGGSAEALTDPEIEEAVEEAFPVVAYNVTITLTNPINPSSFGYCDIRNATGTGMGEQSDMLASIDSPTGSVTVSVDPTIATGVFVVIGGLSVSWGTNTYTGGVTSAEWGDGGVYFAVSGDGTITIDGVDYDD